MSGVGRLGGGVGSGVGVKGVRGVQGFEGRVVGLLMLGVRKLVEERWEVPAAVTIQKGVTTLQALLE